MVKTIDSTTQAAIQSWLDGAYDEATKAEIRRLQNESPDELIDAFYKRLEFGTGGLRSLMGVGTNRLNRYTIGSATQGLANYINKQPLIRDRHAVVIGFDCRLHSKEFAEEAAHVLAANGIEVYLFQALRPVPLVSFGVRHKKAIAGIMITASHNPRAYNGYKVYWDYGGQVLPPHDRAIIDEVEQILSPDQVKTELLAPIHEVGDEIDVAYLKAIDPLQLHPGNNHSRGKELHVVYTPLFGSGVTLVPPALKEWGFTKLTLVEEQATPDGSFPNLKTPNPEDHAALALGIEKLREVKGDLLLATDPDSDRIGVVAWKEGAPFFFNGNEIACILLEHICHSLRETHTMPPKPMCVKTIVTTELFAAIAEHYEVGCCDVLTGFKYIGEKIAAWEKEELAGQASHHYLFGGEESYGYLLGTHARDKDAIVSAACICEAALHMKLQGKTLVDLLYEIYQKHGIYREKLISLNFEGRAGVEKMSQLMKKLRENPPQSIAGVAVDRVEDYLTHERTHLESGKKESLAFPRSNVLRFWLSDGTKIVIRPSGTEPKIKIYGALKEKHHLSNRPALEKAILSADKRLSLLLATLEKNFLNP